MRTLQNRIDLLTAETNHLTAKVQTTFNEVSANYAKTIEQLSDHAKTLRENKIFQDSPEFQIYLNNKQLHDEIKELNKERKKTEDELWLLNARETTLNGRLGNNYQTFKGQIAALNATLARIEDDIAARKMQMMGPIPPRFGKYAEQIKAFEQYFDQHKVIDPALKGLYGLEDDENEKADWSELTKIALADSSNTPDGFIKGMFDHFFNIEMAIDPWLQSPKMTSADQRERRLSLYNLIAYTFITTGKLVKIDCHGYALKLRRDDVMVLAPSLPERVNRSDKLGAAPNETGIIFKRLENPFTPPANDPELPFGIDPVSAALIYRKNLSDLDKTYVFSLLTEHLRGDDDQLLTQARAALKGPSGPLIAQTVELFSEVGLAIEKNFGLMLDAEWQARVKEDAIDPPPLIAQQPKALKKRFQTREFTPQFIATLNNIPGAESIKKDLSNYQTVFEAMNPEAVLRPLTTAYPARIAETPVALGTAKNPEKGVLNYQYHIVGQNPKAQALSNQDNFRVLTNFLFPSKYGKSSVNISTLQFISIIQSAPNNLGFNFQSEVTAYELEALANALGVRIGIFRRNCQTEIDENGLQVPKNLTDYVGPNTKETHYVYLDEGHVYAMWPRLNTSALVGKAKVAALELEKPWSQEYINYSSSVN